MPTCGVGYTCVYGQCQLTSPDGKTRAILCEDYCTQLQACGRSSLAQCKAGVCARAATLPADEKQHMLRVYECHLAATCAEIKEYLEQHKGFLRSCIGCTRDSHCPGGFRCDPTKKLCLNHCNGPGDCRSGYQCNNGLCE